MIINYITNIFLYLQHIVQNVNSNKYFIGIAMIFLNIGSKFITIQFSKSVEEYLKMMVTKQVLIFSMAFLGTRCIITSLILVAVFTILSDHLFNEDSNYCIVPPKSRILHKLIDNNNDNLISETEINNAIAILERAKKEKEQKQNKESFINFHEYVNNNYI